jgi:hypothetical protein
VSRMKETSLPSCQWRATLFDSSPYSRRLPCICNDHDDAILVEFEEFLDLMELGAEPGSTGRGRSKDAMRCRIDIVRLESFDSTLIDRV